MMKLWKETLIQFVLIISIYNIIVYTNNYGGASNYYFLVFPMLAYMILMPGINDLINKSNKTLLKKTILKTILPLFFGGYVLLGFFAENAKYFIYESFLYIIPGSVSFVINLYLAKKNK